MAEPRTPSPPPQAPPPLAEYRRKRDFGRTPEPAGEPGTTPGGALYIMHMHAASHDHFDLRLEHQGVLRSWALPKGPSLEPGEKRLAVEVEDHPIEYGSFEGVIPKGEYGGGTVMLWDAGSWRVNGKCDDNHIDFVLDGEKLKGAWTLVRTRGSGKRATPGKSWLLIKRSDTPRRRLAPEDVSVVSGRTMEEIARDRDRVWSGKGQERPEPPSASALKGAKKRAMPRSLEPQLATLVEAAPDGEGWIHEIKYDGYRVLARIDGGKVRLFTRNGHDWTTRFAPIAAALAAVPAKRALLDGELVVLDPDGATSFRKLQEALSAGRTGSFVYYVFDLPHLDGYDLGGVPQLQRKEALSQLLAASGFDRESLVRYSDHLTGHGPEFHGQACQLGLEGIIAKRANAPYRAGRGKAWLKVKCTLHEEFVVCGFTDPGGGRKGFGSLLLAGHENGRLVYAGRVGTGFSSRQLDQLHRQLKAIETGRSPLSGKPPSLKGVHWVEPALVAEVEFTERTRDGHLRHPSFRGLREDKEAREIGLPGIADMDEPATTKAGSGRVRRVPGEAEVAGVRISNPDRIMYPEAGVTKLDIARYYEEIQDWVLPGMAHRPLTLVRCPEGWQGECFYQKHLGSNQAKSVPRVGFRESSGVKEYAYVESAADIVALVQAGVLEIHPFGCRVGDLERPDLMVFDLDPSPDVPWREMLRVTRELRARIEALGLGAFLRTTGGKGVHIVVPLEPRADWDTVKRFSQRVSELHASDDPARLTTNMAKAKRRGRIFIDYLRNGRGATAVASYSLRAREGAPLAAPVRWDELSGLAPGRYTLRNIRRRLAALKADPWEDFQEAARPLDAALLRKVGMKD